MRPNYPVVFVDFGKIVSGSALPICAMVLLTILSFGLGFVPCLACFVGWLILIASIAINIWQGYDGVKKHKFDYTEAAIAGLLLGIVNGIVTFAIHIAIVAAIPTYTTDASPAMAASASIFKALSVSLSAVWYLVTGITGTVIAIIGALVGAWAANNEHGAKKKPEGKAQMARKTPKRKK
jgi:hypothetical protein